MLYPFEGVKPILKFSRSPYFSCSAWAKTVGKLSGGGTLFTSCKFSSCLSSLLAMTIERSSKLSWLHTEDWELRNIVVGVAAGHDVFTMNIHVQHDYITTATFRSRAFHITFPRVFVQRYMELDTLFSNYYTLEIMWKYRYTLEQCVPVYHLRDKATTYHQRAVIISYHITHTLRLSYKSSYQSCESEISYRILLWGGGYVKPRMKECSYEAQCAKVQLSYNSTHQFLLHIWAQKWQFNKNQKVHMFLCPQLPSAPEKHSIQTQTCS